MPITREVHNGDWRIRLDLGVQVLALEATEYPDSEQPLLPTLSAPEGDPVSAAALLLKAKQFDDGLQAAVELAARHGAGRFLGKIPLLRSLATTLVSDTDTTDVAATILILAACELGGFPIPAPVSLQPAIRAIVEGFLHDAERSKPLGFFTWSPELEAAFHQDRLLQEPLHVDTAAALVLALNRIPDGWPAYDACLRLAERLTNPLASSSLREQGDEQAIFPPSRSHEVTLFEKLYGDQPVPTGFDLMAELIRRFRAGKIRLSPTDSSGWYDRQTWSLAPLIVPDNMPESARLDLGKRYRRHLEDLFRGVLALTRETHAKQGGGGRGGYGGATRQPIWIRPGLTVEPLPSLYRRRADCYRFLRSVLDEAFGNEAVRQLHRLTPEGPCQRDLAEELDGMQRLFDGAAATASRELGMETMLDSSTSIRCFAEWRARLAQDQDISRDARMIVPVFYDLQRAKTKVWAFLGWRAESVSAGYSVEPTILTVEPTNVTEQSPVKRPPVYFSSDSYDYAVPVMVEIYVEKLLNRHEFRRHCDRYQRRSAILANLP